MQLNILNVGDGDTKITFDKDNEQDKVKAAAMITDLLRRGFAIMVEVGHDDKGPLYRRVESFDPETFEYVVMGAPEAPADETVTAEQTDNEPTGKRPDGRRKRHNLPASGTSAVAVSRTAGG